MKRAPLSTPDIVPEGARFIERHVQQSCGKPYLPALPSSSAWYVVTYAIVVTFLIMVLVLDPAAGLLARR